MHAVDGTYDFYWRITTAPILSRVVKSEEPDRVEPTPAGFTADLSWAQLEGFFAPEYRADWRTDGVGTAAPRTAALFGTGPTFFFSERFLDDEGTLTSISNSTLTSGGESRFFFLDTDAQRYGLVALMRSVRCWGARRIYPLPVLQRRRAADPDFRAGADSGAADLALMLFGLGVIIAVSRRRRRAAPV